MKTLMILGASVLQLPAVIKAKEMGNRVVVVDRDKSAVAIAYADLFENISTLDIDRVREAAKKHCIDGIMTLASDMPMRTVAKVSHDLGLVGVSEETAMKATDKLSMRKCLQENKIPIPRFFKVSSLTEYTKAVSSLDAFCIVKPSDNSGSRGVSKIENIEQASSAFTYAKQFARQGDLVVEEYLSGHEVSVESITVKNETHVIAITDKKTTGAPEFVEMGHVQPSKLDRETQDLIVDITRSSIKAIGLEEGPSHTEIIITGDGPKVVEIGARLGGDNITTHLVPLSTGVDIVKCSIHIALGEPVFVDRTLKKGAAIRFIESKPGRIVSITGIEEAKKICGVKQITFNKKTGDWANVIRDSSDRLGFVIAQADTREAAISICNKAVNRISIQTGE